MITNDRQYKIVKSQVEKFASALKDSSLNTSIENIHPRIIEAQRSAIKFKLDDMSRQIKEYEDLKEGRSIIAPVNSWTELPLTLIKARIANNLTQGQLANLLGLKEQQIQKYESENYESASLRTLLRIADKLSIQLTGEVQLRDVTDPELGESERKTFKEMYRRNWLVGQKYSYADALKNAASVIDDFFTSAQVPSVQYALNRKSIRAGSALNEFALTAWHARVVMKARMQVLDVIFDKQRITRSWLTDLAQLSAEVEGTIKACDYLKESGIRIVFESHLEGTHLDGSSFLLDDLYPVIALTLRHDRLDNFWFVLFHEVAHIVLHLGDKYTIIFDDLDVNADGIELEADRFALDALISDEIWKKSLVRFSPSKGAIINQAKALKIHSALIAGRIRRETGKYFEFSDLVGQGEVRIKFQEQLK